MMPLSWTRWKIEGCPPLKIFRKDQQAIVLLVGFIIMTVCSLKPSCGRLSFFQKDAGADPGKQVREALILEVDGLVKKPGIYPFYVIPTRLEAIRQAGGPVDGLVFEPSRSTYLSTTGDRLTVVKRASRKARIVITRIDAAKRFVLNIPLDINSSDAESLDILPGAGRRLTERVVEFRKKYGRFHTVDDLLQVQGIGRKKLEKMRPYLTVNHSSPIKPG